MITNSTAFRCFVALLLTAFALDLLSCSDSPDNDSDTLEPANTFPPVGRVALALTDTDGDAMDDGWETTHFGNLSATAAGDADSDGMTNLEEYLHGFLPTVNDAFDDADGDRYPNVFEVRSGSNPNDQSVLPTPTFLVNAAGGGTHTTISAALTAANVANGAYQIIGIEPGVYTGAANLRSVTVASTKPKLLFIGLQGAAKTIIDGGKTNAGWLLQNSAVVSSLTFRNTTGALLVQSAAKDVRFVDLIVRDNTTTASSPTAGLQVSSLATGGKVFVVGSTFLDNGGTPTVKQIKIDAGAAAILNTVVWSQTSGTMLAKATSATLTTNNCLVKDQTLTGTGNLAGNVDPKLLPDGHLLWNSPLRAAGGTVPQSRIDMDGNLRPSSAPDIGVDQFNDADADELADGWEVDYTGNLTTLTARAQDADADGLSNDGEYVNGTNPLVVDSDADGVSDGDEVLVHGSSPLNTDTDRDDMPDGWEVDHGLAPLVDNAFDDADGDRYPNVFEYFYSTDPTSSAALPTPTLLVNGAGGGTHTTISAALTTANAANGAYQIIAIAPGVYTGAANLRNVTVASTKPKLLFIGVQGAAKTIIDGGKTNAGWLFQNSAVVSSLTFRNTVAALVVQTPAKEVRFIDLMVRDNTNASSTPTPGLAVSSMATGGKVYLVGSTFLDNTGTPTVKQISIDAGAATLVNTVVWSQTSGTMLAKGASATLTTNFCLVKDQTLTGTGNLAGSVDPKLVPDGHVLRTSPLRGAGGTIAQSRIDMDGELRPSSAPDIGVDQFNDSDADELADSWEIGHTGNLTTLTSRTQDGDTDGLSNDSEYANGTSPVLGDTDGDGVSDGDEVLVHGSSPLNTDTDRDDMPDGWEVSHGLAPLVENTFEDADGDRYPNVFEYAGSTNPSDSLSIPTPTLLVDGAGGGTHTTMSAALSATTPANGAYQIIGIAPGVYAGVENFLVTTRVTQPKLLFIGLQGAANTILDGGNLQSGWIFQNSTVVSSLTFRKARQALTVETPAKEVRFVDLIVRDNTNTTGAVPALRVTSMAAGGRVYVVGSTFLDNTGSTQGQIYFAAGAGTLVNTVVWSQASGTMVAAGSGATLTTNHSLAKGQTLTGTGNLAGSVDPKLRFDAHLLWNSPLRAAGGTVAQSRVDMDGELRPSTGRDIGVDQFNDSDADELADSWELEYTGNQTTLTGRSEDGDADDLSNDAEYASGTDPLAADTDDDDVSDGDEVLVHGSNPVSADTDHDEMPDGWEVDHGLATLVDDAFEDSDKDRYPNVFEHAGSTDPTDSASTPTPTYLVNAAGGGTHTTVGAALTAANAANGDYQVIAIAPGVYTGAANLRNVTVAPTKPKLLFIGLEGAVKTIIDGSKTNEGWLFQNSAVVSCLTFRNTVGALTVGASSVKVRFVDLVVRDNYSSTNIPGLHVVNAGLGTTVHVTGSTFLNNMGVATLVEHIRIDAGAATLVNTVVWSQWSGTMVATQNGATLTANYSLVKDQTLTGTGNLAGNVDPKLLPDGHLLRNSPLRGAGGTAAPSPVDMDGEPRPSSAPDIGADQFDDPDGDGLPDAWEVASFGNTTSMVGSADGDNDQLSNVEEYDRGTDWLQPDTDKDGVMDGLEVALGSNPLIADADEMAGDLNQDGVIDSIGVQLGHQPNELDSDGDSISNADEILMGTSSSRADSDGDGVPDNSDSFPFDPFFSTLPSDPLDVSPPAITLTSPWYAVEQ